MRPLRKYLEAELIDKPAESFIIILGEEELPKYMAKVLNVGKECNEVKKGDIIEFQKRSIDHRFDDTVIIQEADILFIHDLPKKHQINQKVE